jgi:subtilisin family serine protease
MKRLTLALLGLCALLGLARPATAEPVPAPAARQAEQARPRRLLVMLRLPARHFRPDAAYGGSYLNDGGQAARRRVAVALTQAYGLKLVEGWPMPFIGIDCFLMEAGPELPLDVLLEAIGRDPRVEWAQAVNEFESLDGGDPLLPLQPAAQRWQLAGLHRASTGKGVAVAVIDSAVDAGHPDLRGQLALYENFVEGDGASAERHGTAVAGIIAARAGNGVGIAGMAPDARVMALRACWEPEGQRARCNSFTLGKAINFALGHQARVINLSLGGPPDRLLHALLDSAAARGILVVAAVDPRRADGGFPASHPGVLPVAADEAGARLLPGRAMLAPGTDIPTSLPGARWGFVSGSSFAAAHVTGLAALLAELAPGAQAALLRQFLSGPAATAHAGPQAGSMDACAILARAAGACVCPCLPSPVTSLSHSR